MLKKTVRGFMKLQRLHKKFGRLKKPLRKAAAAFRKIHRVMGAANDAGQVAVASVIVRFRGLISEKSVFSPYTS